MRIGITLNYRGTGDGDGQVYLDQRYIDFFSTGGQAIVPIVPSDNRGALEAVLDAVDGVIFSGGYDLDSALWAEPMHEKSIMLPRKRQDGEMLLYELVIGRKLPVFGICLGVQLINVAEGGSIYQHVPDLKKSVVHQAEGSCARHDIVLADGSMTRELLGQQRVNVNSYHHQSVLEVGPGLAVAAWSDDGLVEAVEKPGYPFLIAVQWHPERDQQNWVSLRLREAFLTTCREKC